MSFKRLIISFVQHNKSINGTPNTLKKQYNKSVKRYIISLKRDQKVEKEKKKEKKNQNKETT